MKHKMKISLSNKPLNCGVMSCHTLTVRESFLRFMFGKPVKLTVIVPGDSVEEVDITELSEGGTQYEAI